jgi:hypothetical protein
VAVIAKLVQGTIDPARVDVAARAVEEDLIPAFVAHPGALQGYWMANRRSGDVLAMTCWASLEQLEEARAEDGAERVAVMEHLGVRIYAVQTLTVVGVEENHDSDHPVMRLARATWVERLRSGPDASLGAMHREAVRMQASSPGFCASYWLADFATGNGLGLSFWSGLDALQHDEVDSRRRRAWFESTIDCKVDVVAEYEAIGVVASAPETIDLTEAGVTR